MTRLHAQEAIDYAEQHGLTLSKYTDPTEEGRDGLTVDEAVEIAAEDAGLIYIDSDNGFDHKYAMEQAQKLAESAKWRTIEVNGYGFKE